MTATPDILLFSADHRLEAVVEVKSKRGAGEVWATQFRRNLLAHGLLPSTDYFLLVFPDTVYLWQGTGAERPSLTLPTAEALGPFEQALREASGDESSFELVVSSWLQSLTDPKRSETEIKEAASWLVDTGLYERIRGGHVEHRAAA